MRASSTSHMSSMEALPPELTELNLLTLNCWGLLHLSAQRAVRLQEIGRTIAATEPTPHIVALQECWTQEDYQSIRRATRFILPYGKFYHSGAFGGGLAILSRWPIEESSMYQYPLNGRPTAFFRGDWFVGKGVACAKIRYGGGPRDVVEVFNTHTHPSYEHGTQCSYTAHRLSQAWELAKLLRGAAARGHLVVALGDFNETPLSPMHRIVTSHAPVRDVWRILHPDSSLGSTESDLERARCRPVPAAQFNIEENGATSNSIYNTWRWPKAQQRLLGQGRQDQWPEIAPDSPDPRGQRLDYIFASSGLVEGEIANRGWVVQDARVGMVDRHPQLGCSLSDHFSVEATLVLHHVEEVTSPTSSPRLRRNRSRSANHSRGSNRNVNNHHHNTTTAAPPSVADTRVTDIPDADLQKGVYLESPSTSEMNLPLSGSSAAATTKKRRPSSSSRAPPTAVAAASSSISSHSAQLQAAGQPIPYLTSGAYDDILREIHAYTARERFQRRWRGVHFGTWVIVTIICYIGVWWTPPHSPYVAFILMLLSSLGLTAGVVDGLIALLFIGSEMRALKEFEWEIMNAKASATATGRADHGSRVSGDEDGEAQSRRRQSSRQGSQEKK